MRTRSLAVLCALFAIAASLCVAGAVERLPMGRHRTKVPVNRWAQRFAQTSPQQGGESTLPLGGDIWPVSIYWILVDVGTPPVSFCVAVDSGSGDLNIPYVDCKGCIRAPPNHAYDDKNSSTSKPVPCDGCSSCYAGQCVFSDSYQTCVPSDPVETCTISGLVWSDEVSIGSLGPVNVIFGSTTYQTSNFEQFFVCDGVLGLAGPSGQNNVFRTLVEQGYAAENVFGMCFVEGSTSNGTISFGGIDSDLYTGEIQYVQNTAFNQGQFYGLNLQSINVMGHTVEINNPGTILDSGTNVLLLPAGNFAAIQKIFQANCSDCSGGLCALPGVCGSNSLFDAKCFSYTPEQIAQFPDIDVIVDSVTLTLHASDYLLQGEQGELFCFGIIDTGVGGFAIVGDTLMSNYYVVFDNVKGRIGWAPVNRQTCGSV